MRLSKYSSLTTLRALFSALGITASLAILGPNRANAYSRPIEDFLSNQGTFIPGAFIVWTDPAVTSGADLAEFDYAGIDNAKIVAAGLPSLGTEISGSIDEEPLSDGRARVHLVLQARNALAWASFFNFNDPLPF